MNLPEDGGRLYRIRRRRRLRRARRVLSGGFPGRVRGAQIRPAGEMGRGPPRAFHGDRPFARDRMRSRDRARPRRHHPRPARRHLGRHRRLCAAERHDAGAQCRAVHHRAVSRPEPAPEVARDGDQQDAIRHLSRAGPLRGLLLHGAAARHGGEGSRPRPARDPAAQSHRARRDAVSAGAGAAERRLQRHRLRQRRLCQRVRSLRRGCRLAREGWR